MRQAKKIKISQQKEWILVFKPLCVWEEEKSQYWLLFQWIELNANYR